MDSRQRLLSAIRRQPVDHTSLYLRLWDLGSGEDRIPFAWRDQVQRCENLLRLQVDDTLLLQPPLGYTEEYQAEQSPGVLEAKVTRGSDGVLRKTYRTPAGELTQAVRLSEDWPHGEDILLFSDFNIPRMVEPIIKTAEDIQRLRYLLAEPNSDQVAAFKQQAETLRQHARRLGVLLDGGWSALGDAAVWLCGTENIFYWQMDQPEVLESLMDALLEWELRRVEQVLSEGAECLVHMAWYEGTDFWTPRNYRRIIRPRLQQLVNAAHARGVPFRYIITKGWKPLRGDLLEMGVDCITGVDPLQDQVDLMEVKQHLGGKMCLMGGINAALTVSMGSEPEIRAAVERAMDILAPGGGFILFPVDNIMCDAPWEKVEILIDQWKSRWG